MGKGGSGGVVYAKSEADFQSIVGKGTPVRASRALTAAIRRFSGRHTSLRRRPICLAATSRKR